MPITGSRNRRRFWTIAGSVVIVGLIAVTASASHSFTDVPDTHTFHNDIEWMKDTGVTRGCNPPANDRYCPNDFTTRGEMAAFFHRFALAGVIDAATLEGNPASAFLGVNDQAADSALLDGRPASDFLGANDKATDSDLLDGKDSSEFLGVNDQAADSALLDGRPASDFLGVDDQAADSALLDGRPASDFLGVDDQAADSALFDGLSSDEFVKVGDSLGAALAASIYVAEETETWLLAINNEVVASCDPGDVLIGGGYDAGSLLGVNIFSNRPDGADWVVQGTVTLLGDVTAHAICVSS